MARSLEQIIESLLEERQARIERRSNELATLKDLRLAVELTQVELAQNLGVRQDTISRMERKSDMLLSTLRKHIEAMGGKLELVVHLPNREPVIIDHLMPVSRHDKDEVAAA